jgi:hypothetical protein
MPHNLNINAFQTQICCTMSIVYWREHFDVYIKKSAVIIYNNIREMWLIDKNSWIYNYLCNLPITTRVVSSNPFLWGGVLHTTLCDKVCQWLASGTPVSSTNKTDHHDIAEILLKVALNTINLILFICIIFCLPVGLHKGTPILWTKVKLRQSCWNVLNDRWRETTRKEGRD